MEEEIDKILDFNPEILKNGLTNEPDNTIGTGRNPDGTWKKGFCPNPGGRSKKPIKEYLLKKFNLMSDEEKEEIVRGLPIYQQIVLAEGNPKQESEIEVPSGLRVEFSSLFNKDVNPPFSTGEGNPIA